MSEHKISAAPQRGFVRTIFARLLPAAVILAVWFVACNGPFDPRGPLDQQLVVFSVLSTDRNVQFVRVNSNYMPVGYDPLTFDSDAAVRDALVSMAGNGGSYIFRDTTVTRPDTSRYKFPLRMYTLGHFTPARGKTYNMLVSSPTLGAASASASIPTKPTIVLDAASWFRLSEPLTRLETEDIQFYVDLSPISKGYMYHLYVYYDVIKDARWQEERVEIPLPPQIPDTSYNFDRAEYSQLTQSPQSNKIFVQFKVGYLIKAIKTLTKVKYVNTHLIYKWIVLTVLQADQNLFGYYKSLRVYQDPLSIRLDQPLYSKIDGGVGLVGAYSLDSLTFVLPENFNGNR
jgi:hypothetical protein